MRKKILNMAMRLTGFGYSLKFIYKHKVNSTFLAIDENGKYVAEGCFVNDSFCETNRIIDDNYDLVFDKSFAIYDKGEIIGYRG